MTPSPIDEFLQVALACVGAQEVPVGSNGGFFVERCQKVTGTAGLKPGAAWCASFVAMVGQATFGKSWPLPLTASCAELGAFATKKNILDAAPQRGDLFVVYFDSLNRFAHVGIVVEVKDGVTIRSVSGNTLDPVRHADEGSSMREGWCVSDRPWRLAAKDRFIRWVNLLPG
ncbi:MAG TPA: CHAP domain-containing protein [Thermoanaerobaculia bacterium]